MPDVVTGLASLRQLTAAYAPRLWTVPPAGPGLCRVCRSAVRAGYEVCVPCRATEVRYGGWAADPVGFVSLAPKRSWFAGDLWRYKTPGAVAAAHIQDRLAAVLWRFLDRHERCLGGPFDLVTTVPSGAGRDPHPLVDLVLAVGPLVDRYQPPTADVAGARVLLVDDTWTTGAHLQAEATRLRCRGAERTAGLALGRHVGVDHPVGAGYVRDAGRRPFDWDRCCLEPRRPGSTRRSAG